MTKHKNDELVDALTHGKLPRNLFWKDVVDMIGHLGRVENHGQEFTFVVGAQRAFFKKPQDHEQLGTEEVASLRHFLRSALQPGGMQVPATGRTVVVVDHHSAEIYREEGRGKPESENRVTPYDPMGFQRHLVHRKEESYRGDRVPEESSYYAEIAGALRSASEIILIGSGTGTSSAVDALTDYLNKHSQEIAQRVIAVYKVDLSALTASEIEEIARKRLGLSEPATGELR